ncbi:MAG TPA: response regulator transcription factor [Solirubrobacteraceae bacterium]|nr:response regulator transcription factor [Solirubrobacteraceae bacterium]
MLAERSDQPTAATPQHRQSSVRAAVIDRDKGFMQVLVKRLEALGWDYTVVSSPVTPEALVRMRLNALIVDVSVIGPDCWGYLEQVCARLPGMSVVVSTGPSSVAQRVRGLRLGVDAWVTKPCHPEELICVVEATLRRHRRRELAVLDPPTSAGELTIRADLHQVYVDDLSAELTAREFEILQLLAQSDRVLRREEIYERIWGYAMSHGDRSVDVFVGKLRQKLRITSPGWSYIHTHFGVGYRFAPKNELGGEAAPREADEAAAVGDAAADEPLDPVRA